MIVNIEMNSILHLLLCQVNTSTRKESNIMMTWSTCCWTTRSHPLWRCTTGIYRRWALTSLNLNPVWSFPSLTGSCGVDNATCHSAGAAGEVRRLAERQHGELLQRLRQPVLWEVWKQSEVLDHVQQSVGMSGWGGTMRSLSHEETSRLSRGLESVLLCFQSIAVEGYETGEHAPGLKLKGTGAYKAAHHIIKVSKQSHHGEVHLVSGAFNCITQSSSAETTTPVWAPEGLRRSSITEPLFYCLLIKLMHWSVV